MTTPTSNQPPRSAQGRRLLGPAALYTCPFASLLSQSERALGPGATVGILGMGVPRLACLRPAAWLSSVPVRPVFINPSSRPSRGAKPRGAGNARPPRGQPHQAGSRGAHDASHDDQDKAGTSLHSVLISSLVQRGEAQAQSTEASGKGFHIGATRPRPAGQQVGGHRGAQDGVITSTFGSRRPPLVRIACTSCPLSKWPLLDPFPLNIWEEDQGLYK